MAADGPPDVAAAARVKRDATVADVVRSAIVRSLLQLLSYDPAIRLSEDPEAVHKARVATRRLRSDLRTFRPVLEPAWSEPLRTELQWLGRALGQVRDADVLLAALTAQAAALPDDHQTAAARLRHTLEEARGRDRAALLETLDSDRYAQLLDRLVAAADQPRFRGDAARSRATTIARNLVAKPRRRFEQATRGLDRFAPDPSLHEARKRRSRCATRRKHSPRSSASGLGSWPIASRTCSRSSAITRTRWSRELGSSTPRAMPTIEMTRSSRASSRGGSSMRRKQHARQWPRVRRRALNVEL